MQKQQRAKAGMKPPTQRYNQLEKRSRKDKKEFMRSLALLLAVLTGPVFARTIFVPTQPVSEFADTEVSTNIVMHTSRTDTRDVEIHIQLAGTPTNNLEIAFGRDVNTNGVLEAEEIETVYGWRAGRYFIENACSWERFEAEAATNALCGVVDIQLKTNAEIVPKRFTAICGGETAFAGLATSPPPAWLFREGWNMVRVTRRGAGLPSEWVRCKFDYKFFRMTLR